MLNLMIIDDEKATCEGLKHFINWWELYKIKIVSDAQTGYQALEYLKKNHVDLILCDIKMPSMDGVELSRIINKQYPHIKIIFLSGYSDKDYLRNAIRVGAVDYLEKPIDEKQLHSALDRIINKSDVAVNMSSEHKNTIAYLTTSQDEKLVMKLAKETGLKRSEDCIYSMMVIWFRDDILSVSDYILVDTINITISKCINKDDIFYLVGWTNNKIAIIFSYDNKFQTFTIEDYYNRLNNIANKIKNTIKTYKQSIECILIGRSYNEILKSPEEFMLVKQSKKYMFFRGYESIVSYDDLHNGVCELSQQQIDELSQLLNVADIQGAISLVDLITIRFASNQNTKIEYIKNYYVKIFNTIISFINRQNTDDNSTENYIINKEAEIPTIFALKDKALGLIDEYYKIVTKDGKHNKIIFEAKKYIYNNISENFTVYDIAKKVYVTPQYLSSLFKKQASVNIKKYIINMKMKHASKLMVNKEYKLYEVASMIGYNDYQYFVKVFKKSHGLTPSQYRKRYY